MISSTTINEKLLTNKKLWSKKKSLSIAIILTLTMMCLEFVYSAITGSLMLYSDAIHMLSHAASLGVSYFAVVMAGKKVASDYPFGLRKIESLTAFVNGIALGMFSLYICYEGVMRIVDPIPISSVESWYVALAGLLVNLITAFVLSKAGLEDLNTRSAFLHMLADTFSSVAIMIGLIVIQYTGWYETDGILSVVVAIVIAKWAWDLTISAGKVLIGVAPAHINHDEMCVAICSQFHWIQHVESAKVWMLNEKENCAVFKVYVKISDVKAQRKALETFLYDKYAINDPTIQFT